MGREAKCRLKARAGEVSVACPERTLDALDQCRGPTPRPPALRSGCPSRGWVCVSACSVTRPTHVRGHPTMGSAGGGRASAREEGRS